MIRIEIRSNLNVVSGVSVSMWYRHFSVHLDNFFVFRNYVRKSERQPMSLSILIKAKKMRAQGITIRAIAKK